MTELLKKGGGPEGNWRGGVEVTTRPPGDEKVRSSLACTAVARLDKGHGGCAQPFL